MEAAASRVWLQRVPGVEKPLVQAMACVAAVAVMAASAQVSIPWVPVPFTLQTLAVLATGLALGSRLGAASAAAYVVAGAAGLPVFSAGTAGLSGPTAGYLLGFILAAWIMGRAAEKGADRKALPLLGALALAHLAIYIPGTLWLSGFMKGDSAHAFSVGVLPFLAGDAIKAAAACFAFPAAWRLFPDRQA